MKPPRLARRLIGWCAPPDLAASLVDDLDEAFARRLVTTSPTHARWWYRRQMLAGLWTFARLRADRSRTDQRGLNGMPDIARQARTVTLGQDLRYAWRAVWHRPALVTVAVLSLALGVGAGTAIFSVVNGVLLRPIDLPQPEQLMLVGEHIPERPDNPRFAFLDTPSAFLAWRQRASSFSALAAISRSSFTVTSSGRPELVYGAHVSTNFFDLLEVRPHLGRLLAPDDERDTTRPMVITDRLWRSAFSADAGVIGRRVGVPGAEATVIGVLPAEFHISGSELGPMLAGAGTDYFDALHLGGSLTEVFTNFNYSVIGRLRPGVTRTAALAELNAIQAALAQSAKQNLTLTAELTPVLDFAVAATRQRLVLLMAGVLAVLLIVCVNLAGLWVTRVADDRRAWGIRAALGASPARLARQVLAESLIVALAGGCLGVACAAAGLRALLAVAPADLPRLDDVRLDWRVLAFGFVLSIAAGLVTGMLPALRLMYGAPQGHLKITGAATTADRGSLRSRQALIGLQATLSTVLLAAAGLLGLSLYRLVSQPTGFNADHAVSADVVLSAYGDANRDALLQRLPGAVAELPGVTAVSFISQLPLRGETWIDAIAVPGRTVAPADQPSVNVRFVSPGYFSAIGIPVLAGRDLDDHDRPTGPPPTSRETQPPGFVVLSRATARLLWPGDRLLDIPGRVLLLQGDTVHVVGIADDARADLSEAAPPVVYVPYWEQTPFRVSLVIRSAMPTATLAAPVRSAIWRVAPLAPIPALGPLDALEATAVAPQRFQLVLLASFAGVALLLAAMGVHALVAHSVAQRRKELALRLTLGAGAGHLWRLILGQGLGPVTIGVVAGLAIAIAAGRVLTAMLFHVSPATPQVLVPAAIVVFIAAAAACVRPARRAIRADPWPAIRAE